MKESYFSMLKYFDGEELPSECGAHDVSVNIKVSREIIVSELNLCLDLAGHRSGFIEYKDISLLGTLMTFLCQKLELLGKEYPGEAVEACKEMIEILENTETNDDSFPDFEVGILNDMIEKFDKQQKELSENDMNSEINKIADAFSEIHDAAYIQYKPIAEDLCGRIASENEVEHTLDYMLSLCGDERVFKLFNRICHHYINIYPEAIAFQINTYREIFEEDDEDS